MVCVDVQSKSFLSDLPRETCFGGSLLSLEFNMYTHCLYCVRFLRFESLQQKYLVQHVVFISSHIVERKIFMELYVLRIKLPIQPYVAKTFGCTCKHVNTNTTTNTTSIQSCANTTVDVVKLRRWIFKLWKWERDLNQDSFDVHRRPRQGGEVARSWFRSAFRYHWLCGETGESASIEVFFLWRASCNFSVLERGTTIAPWPLGTAAKWDV